MVLQLCEYTKITELYTLMVELNGMRIAFQQICNKKEKRN